MTAVSLFDVLSRSDASKRVADGDVNEPIERLAAQLVEASLSDWRRIRQYETEFTPVDWTDRATALEADQSIYAMHAEWAGEAEQILLRVRHLAASGHPIPQTDDLLDAMGMARARLKLMPGAIASATDRMNAGPITPAKDLRDELNSRLRA